MYHSEVCVIGWVHQEVDYNMQTLIFVEPKDHLKRLHLKQKFWLCWICSTCLAGFKDLARRQWQERIIPKVLLWGFCFNLVFVWSLIFCLPDLVYIWIRPIVRGIQDVKSVFNLLHTGEQGAWSSLASRGVNWEIKYHLASNHAQILPGMQPCINLTWHPTMHKSYLASNHA